MIVRICREPGCHTHLSYYNPTVWCWEHHRSTRRIEEELAGQHVQRDDDYLIRTQRPAEVETWRPHIMSDTFVAGLERRVMPPADRRSYADGTWLGELPNEEEDVDGLTAESK